MQIMSEELVVSACGLVVQHELKTKAMGADFMSH
jgi:hypothetical protein